MKSIFLLFTFLLTTSFTFSQNYYEITFEGNGINELDTQFHSLSIDITSNPNNIWQIGMPQKNIFDSAYTVPNAIVTDTIQPYPINDTSSFIIHHIVNAGIMWSNNADMKGQYFVNSDTLTDFGMIEVSVDNGVTWIDMLNDTLLNYGVGYSDSKPVLSGNSGGWTSFKLFFSGLNSLPGYPSMNYGDTVLFRFSFISDSIQTNKDGLMFDNIFVEDVPPVGLHEFKINSNELHIFPNPASKIVYIDYPDSKESNFEIDIIDASGKLISKFSSTTNMFEINIEHFPKGEYYILDSSKKVFGKFVKI
jgi:Secretion system C-terminal sorting domain